MILIKRTIFAVTISLVIWMHHWATRYVHLSDSRAFQQHLVSSEFDPIAEPSFNMWSGDKADYYKQMANGQRIAARDARFAIKGLRPQLRQARFMLIDVSGWTIVALTLAIIGTLLANFRFRKALSR